MLLPMLSAILTVKYGLKRYNKCCKNFDLPNAVISKIGTMQAYGTENAPEEEMSVFSNYDEILLEM